MKPHAKDAADAKQSWECRTPGSTPDSDHRQEAEGFKKSSCLGDPGSRRVRLLLHRPGQAGTMPLVWGERATRPFSAATCRRVRTHDGRPPFSARVVRTAVGREGLRSASRPGLQRVATKRIFRIPPRLSPPPPAATGDRSRSVRLRHRCAGFIRGLRAAVGRVARQNGPVARSTRNSTASLAKSLSENGERCCGWGFGIGARRSGRRCEPHGPFPAAGCDARDNQAPGQKTRRPEGYRAKGRLASLLLSRRPMKGILLRRALPSSLLLDNSTPRHFQTGSQPERCSRR